MVASLKDLLRRQLEKGRKHHACPLCHHAFSGSEEDEFVRNVREMAETRQINDARAKRQAELDTARRLVREMNEQMLSWHDWKRLKARAAELEAEVAALDEAAGALTSECDELQQRSLAAAERLQDAEALRPDAATVRSLAEAVSRLESDVETLRRTAGGGAAAADGLEDVHRRYEDAQRRRDAAREVVSRVMTTLDKHDTAVQRLRSQITSLGERRLKLENEVQQSRVLTTRRDDLQKQLDKARGTKERLERELAPLLTEVQRAKASLERLRLAAREREDVEQRRCRELERALSDINSRHSALQRLQRSDPEGRLRSLMQKLDAARSTADEKAAAVAQLNDRISETTNNIDREDHTQRAVRDNLKFRQLRRELEDHGAKLEEMKARLEQEPGGLDAQERLDESRQRLEQLKVARGRLVGQIKTQKAQIRERQARLKDKRFNDIEEKHRLKLIAHETTQMAVSDLTKYYTALDAALQRYHAVKITEINRIIRDLWQLTYRGNDIETIEIKSDVASATTKGRSYNYRVVMTKGGTELDMRGRCSAGQKVLVGLVVRLALAETFCVNCGILALDEPTTNLDDANKIGFAQALSDIINARRSQDNFQLVVITHDEEFVRELGRAQMLGGSNPGHYYRLSREALAPGKYYSKIERQDWND